ncbi:hypothetical protein C8J57DRAFT_119285 [Mycena rebaudengoi]|nr:hypothetical protein C8J57DRAFT_119285 [Mycena rebaudengoi]
MQFTIASLQALIIAGVMLKAAGTPIAMGMDKDWISEPGTKPAGMDKDTIILTSKRASIDSDRIGLDSWFPGHTIPVSVDKAIAENSDDVPLL